MVSSYYRNESKSTIGYVSFWNIKNYTQKHIINGYGVYESSRMIELSDGNVAFSSRDDPYPIIIIDSTSYQIKKEIHLKDYITRESS